MKLTLLLLAALAALALDVDFVAGGADFVHRSGRMNAFCSANDAAYLAISKFESLRQMNHDRESLQ